MRSAARQGWVGLLGNGGSLAAGGCLRAPSGVAVKMAEVAVEAGF